MTDPDDFLYPALGDVVDFRAIRADVRDQIGAQKDLDTLKELPDLGEVLLLTG